MILLLISGRLEGLKKCILVLSWVRILVVFLVVSFEKLWVCSELYNIRIFGGWVVIGGDKS